MTAETLAAAAAHFRDGRLDAAELGCEEVLAASPDHGGALHLLGLVHWRRGARLRAIDLMERAAATGAAEPSWHRDLTEMCRVEGRLDDAIRHGDIATALRPEDAEAHYNLGIVHYDRGEIAEAIACQRRALALTPGHAAAHFELAEALLLDGDFRAGWKEYDWRFRMEGVPQPIPPSHQGRPRWQGEPMEDKTLLLVADQGFGDAIQFLRYIPQVAARCRDLAIACSAEVLPLVAQVSGRARLFQLWQDAPAFDRHATLSDLPGIFGTTLDTIPATVPYLRAEPARLDLWRRRLRALTPAGHRRIGLVWAGRPGHGNDRNRSMSLRRLAPLAALRDVTLVSLQKGAAGAETGGYYGAAPLVNLAPEIGDFRDTAAILETLDFLVTVDTSVAHLAGALGRPAAVLLPFAPDWRWLRHRADSPWYPTLRLYRQPRPGDWNDVFARLVADLARG